MFVIWIYNVSDTSYLSRLGLYVLRIKCKRSYYGKSKRNKENPQVRCTTCDEKGSDENQALTEVFCIKKLSDIYKRIYCNLLTHNICILRINISRRRKTKFNKNNPSILTRVNSHYMLRSICKRIIDSQTLLLYKYSYLFYAFSDSMARA